MQLKARLHGLDHLRALAIFLVFIFHYGPLSAYPPWLADFSRFGWTGVDLFFVLSGYLIASQLFAAYQEQENISLKNFYIKRFFRIIPPYLLVVAIYFLIPGAREREAPAPLWKYLTFTQNLGLDLSKQGTFSHAWSLCIEEQFYLLLPLVILILIKTKTLHKGWWLIPALSLAGAGLRIWSWHTFVEPAGDDWWIIWYKWIYYPTCTRLDGLLAGISIAAMLHFKPLFSRRLQEYSYLFLTAGILILTAAFFLCKDQSTLAASVYGFPLVSVGYGCIVFAAVSPANILYRHSSVITSYIAILSYLIYLTHKIVNHLVQDFMTTRGFEKNSLPTFLVAVTACVLVAVLLRQLIEKPAALLRKKLIS
ncbi:acyltransferase [Chitinophaga sp. Cy-1792]|uniref:acyltransferase family protein n=1 Tax=Chitinophaga sp. Cy-1792 TaxID=2608339 RepID=UPI001422D717|nr:acyltransferase [Chitinophaga sp. Cy-1792]NIG52992.1 acyltransferase [Chitinophaga sp. Cy-1792]